MLQIVWCLVLIAKASSLNYGEIAVEVENTLTDCLVYLEAVGKFIDDIYSLQKLGRRVEETDDSVDVKLGFCVSVQKSVDEYRSKYSRVLLIQEFITGEEHAYVNNLLKPLSKKIGEAIYIASLDGDAASDFHSACDNMGPTVVIVESMSGAVFGGYTDVNWSSASGWFHKSSVNAFVFRLRPSLDQYLLFNSDYAVFHHTGRGPVFGSLEYADMYIGDYPLSSTNNYALCEGNYRLPVDSEAEDGCEKNFLVKDYIVFTAIAV